MDNLIINENDISSLRVSSLPTKPTLPTAYGGKGYTATELKDAFDKLPLFIIDRFNSLVDMITSENFADNVFVDDETLADAIINIKYTLSRIIEHLEIEI